VSDDGPEEFRPLVIAGNYPSHHHPDSGTFVRNLVHSWTRTGTEAVVVAPHPVFRFETRRFEIGMPTDSGPGEPTVLRPGYMTFSNRRIGPLRTMHWTTRSFARAALRAAKRLSFRPSVVYAHFLFPAGVAALAIARRLGLPVVAALGESGFSLYESTISLDHIVRTVRGFDALLSVSEFNRGYCIEHYGVQPERFRVEPNATDTERFRPQDREALRRRLGLPEDKVILSFSGQFADRKGPLRVMAAIRGMPDVACIFLGDGPDRPSGDQVLVARKVPHDEVADWLAASDIYVLPTLEEGSPNSVIEAMACGLPVISSQLPSLRETTDESCAVLVPVGDVEALHHAIAELAADPERRTRMGAAGRTRASRSSLAARGERIRRWVIDVQRSVAARPS
jgi:glycosyltransferase involved in cell wall biosynthesis